MTIIKFDTLPSTNDFLKENYNSYHNEDVIVALRQTNGRGRFKRIWYSNDDLTFSIIFKENNYHHNLIAPLAIYYALKKYNIHTSIKWPNDIYLNGKKLGGILCESIFEGDIKKCDIVGIGLNTSPHFEKDINSSYIPEDRFEILNHILYTYQSLLPLDAKYLIKEYKKASNTLNMDVIYNNIKYIVKDYTPNLEIILENDLSRIVLNANEIDIKTAMMKK